MLSFLRILLHMLAIALGMANRRTPVLALARISCSPFRSPSRLLFEMARPAAPATLRHR